MKDTEINNHRPPIPTPMRVRWMRFRHQLLPVLTVTACALAAGWLWSHHTGTGVAIGEVEAKRVAVSCNVEGVLSAPAGRAINPHDHVSEGDVIATIDPAPVRARRASRQVEVERLKGEIQAAQAQPGTPPERLDGLRAALASREEDVARLDLELSALDVVAPVSGTVAKVHVRPGQLVKAGEPIMDISVEGASYVVSYLREEQQNIKPMPKMVVEVRPRNDPKHVVQGIVDTVGVQIESVPSRLLRDQKYPEWGLPVRLAIPPDSDLMPGQVVSLVFKRKAS